MYTKIVDEVEKQLIMVTLFFTKFNQLKAAKILGVDRNTLHRKIVKFKLNEEFK